VELRRSLEELKSKLVSTFTDVRILQMTEELRLTVILAAFHAYSLVLALIDSLSQVVKMSGKLAQAINKIMSKSEELTSLLKPGEHHSNLTLTM